jgi:CRP/FNR family transcriptional regulator
MRDRWAKLGKPSVTVPLPMSRQDIADFLGLTIETVSRTFTKLAKDKTILIVPDGVRLLNTDHMELVAAA